MGHTVAYQAYLSWYIRTRKRDFVIIPRKMGHTEQKAQGVSPVVGPVLIKGEAAGRGSSNLPGIPKTLSKEKCHTSDLGMQNDESCLSVI